MNRFISFVACGIVASGIHPPASAHAPTGQQESPTASPAVDTESASSIADLVMQADAQLDRYDELSDRDARQTLLTEVNALLERIRAAEPNNPWLLFLYGRAYAAVGRFGDARGQLLKFIESREGRTEWRAYRILGDMFVEEFPRLARANYDKALALKTGEASILHGLSQCASKSGDNAQAVKLAREAVAADGRKNPRFLSQLARALLAEKNWPDATREAEAALALVEKNTKDRPGDTDAWLKLDQQYQLLIDIAHDGARAHPEAPEHYLHLADFTNRRVRVTMMLALHDALRVLDIGVRATSSRPSIPLLERYAATLAEVGRKQDAVKQYEEIQRLDPNNSSAREALQRLRDSSAKSEPRSSP